MIHPYQDEERKDKQQLNGGRAAVSFQDQNFKHQMMAS
jgi:hypothetical protein